MTAALSGPPTFIEVPEEQIPEHWASGKHLKRAFRRVTGSDALKFSNMFELSRPPAHDQDVSAEAKGLQGVVRDQKYGFAGQQTCRHILEFQTGYCVNG